MADSSDDEALAVLFLLETIKRQRQKKKKRRSVWTRSWLFGRETHGAYHALLQELLSDDPAGYKNFLRMDASSFDQLLGKVLPLIERQDTRFRRCIPADERLALTLRWLATGKHSTL